MKQVEFPLFKSIKKFLFNDKTGTLIWGGLITFTVVYYTFKNGLLYSYIRWDTQIIMIVSIFLSYILYTYLKFYSIKVYEKTRLKNWSDSSIKIYPYPFSYQIFECVLWVIRNLTGLILWISFVLILDDINKILLLTFTNVSEYILYPCSSLNLITTEQQEEIIKFWKVINIVELDCD
jgi:hypothetical protein